MLMQPEVMTIVGGVGMTTSGIALLAQAAEIPGLPDGFESWPVTAMIAVIALACMFLLWKVFMTSASQAKAATEASVKQAEALMAISVAQSETNRRLGEVTATQAMLGGELKETRVQLQNRPCIVQRG